MDPNSTIDQNQIPKNTEHINVSNEFFGWNADVFKNLDKFEQLTNPLWTSANEELAELWSFDSFEENSSDDLTVEMTPNLTEELESSPENELQEIDNQTLEGLDDHHLDSGFDLHDPFLQAVATEENTKDALDDPTDFLMTDLEEIDTEGVEEQTTNSDKSLEELWALEIENKEDLEEKFAEKKIEELKDLDEIDEFDEDNKVLKFDENNEDSQDLETYEEVEEDVEEGDLEKIDEEDKKENIGIYREEIDEEDNLEELEDKNDEEHIDIEEEVDPEEEASKIMETYDPSIHSLQSKFEELLQLGIKILDLDQQFNNIEHQDFFEILGEDSKNAKIIYKIFLNDQETPKVTILRQFWDKKAEEENQNSLIFLLNNEEQFSVMVDEYLLYQEDELADNEREEHEVTTKIDKFIFLFEQKERELNQKLERQQAEREKQKAFRAIFRNF